MTRRPSRARRIAKWGGLVVCALVAVAWMISLRPAGGLSGYGWPNLMVAASHGEIILVRGLPLRGPLHSDKNQTGVEWLPHWRFDMNARTQFITLPFWLLFLLATIPTVILFRRDRIPPGHCQRCGYNLTGNVSGRCPECGCTTNRGEGPPR